MKMTASYALILGWPVPQLSWVFVLFSHCCKVSFEDRCL